MQINITEILKEILLDGTMVEGYGYSPKHPLIYNKFIESKLSFEEFLKSCLSDTKAPEVDVNNTTKVIKINLSQYKVHDYISKESSIEFKEKLEAYKDARQVLYALCNNKLSKELSDNIMFSEFEYMNDGSKFYWDPSNLSFHSELRANKILELSNAE